MALVVNGDGNITGLTPGGLPDASITQSDFATGIAGNGPAFSVYVGSTFSVTGGGYTKIQYNTEEFDTASCYDSTTNFRFTPNVAGYYSFSCTCQPNTTNNLVTPYVYKNGSQIKSGIYTGVGGSYVVGIMSGPLVYLNGTTDYVEFYVYSSSSASVLSNSVNNWASGYMVRAA